MRRVPPKIERVVQINFILNHVTFCKVVKKYIYIYFLSIFDKYIRPYQNLIILSTY